MVRSSFQEYDLWNTQFKAVIGVLTTTMLIILDQKVLILTEGENKSQKGTINRV